MEKKSTGVEGCRPDGVFAKLFIDSMKKKYPVSNRSAGRFSVEISFATFDPMIEKIRKEV